jgi:hypothetical protein
MITFFATEGAGVVFGGADFVGNAGFGIESVGTLKTGTVSAAGVLGFVTTCTGFVCDAIIGRAAFIDERVSTGLGFSSSTRRENEVGISETVKSSAPLPVIGANICFCNLPTAWVMDRVARSGEASPLAYLYPSGPPSPPALPTGEAETSHQC